MSDELKQAAERYREHDAKWKAYLADENRDEPPTYDQLPEDSCRLADFALPLLDGTPLDKPWLSSVGFEDGIDEADDGMHLFFTDAKGSGKWIEVEFESRIWFYLKNHNGSDSMRTYLAHCGTRGELRMLARSLGIDLRETENGK